jgi:ankyrin repeat protein
MPSRSEVHKLFYLICLDSAYDEIPVSKHPGPNELYVDVVPGPYYNNYWGANTTALMVAAQHGREFAIGYLLNHGADASLKNHEGKTPLMLAMTSPGNLGAYSRIGRRGRDNICGLLARNTRFDGMREAYEALHYAAQENLDYTVQTILTCNPLLQQRLNKLFKSQKLKIKNLIDIKQFILHNPSSVICHDLNSSNTQRTFSRRKHKFG